MNKDLKPCPFCGGKAVAFEDRYKKVVVICENCSLYFGIKVENNVELMDGWLAVFNTIDDAVSFWNRRTENENLHSQSNGADYVNG